MISYENRVLVEDRTNELVYAYQEEEYGRVVWRLVYESKTDWQEEEYPVFYEDWKDELDWKINPRRFYRIVGLVPIGVQFSLVQANIELEKLSINEYGKPVYRAKARLEDEYYIEELFAEVDECEVSEGREWVHH